MLIALGVLLSLIIKDDFNQNVAFGLLVGFGVFAWVAGGINQGFKSCIDGFPEQRYFDLNHAVMSSIEHILNEMAKCIPAEVPARLNIQGGSSAQKMGTFLIRSFANPLMLFSKKFCRRAAF